MPAPQGGPRRGPSLAASANGIHSENYPDSAALPNDDDAAQRVQLATLFRRGCSRWASVTIISNSQCRGEFQWRLRQFTAAEKLFGHGDDQVVIK